MRKSFGIEAKLVLAFSVFLLPVGYLLISLYSQQQIAIDFAAKEARGNHYLGILRQAHNDLLALNDPLTGDAAAAIAAAITQAEVDFGAGMEAADQLAAANADLRDGNVVKARSALRALIARIGDKSNLILDPDLDSYYVMDLVLLKVPELMDKVADIAAYAETRAGSGGADFSINDVAGFLQLGGAFDAMVDGSKGALAAGYEGNKNNLNDMVGVLPRRLDPSAETMLAALAAFRDSYSATRLAGGGGELDLGRVKGAAQEALDAILAFGNANDATLDELLTARIDGFRSARLQTFAITGILFALALVGTIFFIHRNVMRPVNELARMMETLAEDHTKPLGRPDSAQG